MTHSTDNMFSPEDSNPNNFLSLPLNKSSLANSKTILLPVPYDGTASYKSGSRDAPAALIKASHQLEDYDLELQCQPSDLGIHTAYELPVDVSSPDAMVSKIESAVHHYLTFNKLVGIIGGEHTITVGAVAAMARKYPDLSVVIFDAHADMRNTYQESRFSHACVTRRVAEICQAVVLGTRSLSLEESDAIAKTENPHVFFSSDGSLPTWQDISTLISPNVYISIDLDILDPSIMSAVGTPEPGGVMWHSLLPLLKTLIWNRHIVGFDITELNPNQGAESCVYTAAKLAYKIIGYSTILSS